MASYGMSGAEQVRPPTHTMGLGLGSARPPNPWAFIILFTYSWEGLGYIWLMRPSGSSAIV